jgi:hypothetical protein
VSIKEFKIDGDTNNAGVPILRVDFVSDGLGLGVVTVWHWWASHTITYSDRVKAKEAYETLQIVASHGALMGAKPQFYGSIYQAWQTKGAKGVSRLIPE